MTENEKLNCAIYCEKVKAGIEMCEECDIYAMDDFDCKDIAREAIKALEEVQEYRKLGTVEEVREAVEKNTPKNIVKKKDTIFYRSRLGEEKYLYKIFCPNCGNGDLKHGFPCKCGQKLNWGDYKWKK